MWIKQLIQTKKLIILCGSGGVGKTTSSAALAIEVAKSGKKVLVLTIDPAKRLANALGLENLSSEAGEVHKNLYALMLDPKKTFDQVISRYASSEEEKNNILNNKLYQHLSSMIAGSQEYMAMEKVYEIYQGAQFDLIILDTPPTRHALDFLAAPEKMKTILGQSILKWFLKPSLFSEKSAFHFLGRGAQKIFSAFDQVMGFDFLKDLSVMLISTAGLLEGFKNRADEVAALLKAKQTALILVSSPQASSMNEAVFFFENLKKQKLPFAGFILNRVKTQTSPLPKKEEIKKEWGLDENSLQEIDQLLKKQNLLARQDRAQIERLQLKTKGKYPITEIPTFSHDVHDLKGLEKMGNYF